jgi:hypothetical protein
MIYVTRNNEGFWINFRTAGGGKQCSIHVGNYLDNTSGGRDGIVGQTIFETCIQDCIMDYSSKPEDKK